MIVYVASDERYNDEVPTQFLELLLQAGKPVVVCLMKMREADAPALVAHFQQEVAGRTARRPGKGVVATLAIPFLTPAPAGRPRAGRRRATASRCSIRWPCSAARRSCRPRAASSAPMHYLVRHQDELLDVARDDLDALQSWQATGAVRPDRVRRALRREYLTSEKFRGFDEALVRLMELLDCPASARSCSGALYVLRTPYRLLAG